jgi:hypothetical protein
MPVNKDGRPTMGFWRSLLCAMDPVLDARDIRAKMLPAAQPASSELSLDARYEDEDADKSAGR